MRDALLLTPLSASEGKEQGFIELRGSTTDPKRHESICQKRGETPHLFAARAVWMGRVCGVGARQPRILCIWPRREWPERFCGVVRLFSPALLQARVRRPGGLFNFGFSSWGGHAEEPWALAVTTAGTAIAVIVARLLRARFYLAPLYRAVRRSVSTTGVLSTDRKPHQPAASASSAPARLPKTGTVQEPVQLKSNT